MYNAASHKNALNAIFLESQGRWYFWKGCWQC